YCVSRDFPGTTLRWRVGRRGSVSTPWRRLAGPPDARCRESCSECSGALGILCIGFLDPVHVPVSPRNGRESRRPPLGPGVALGGRGISTTCLPAPGACGAGLVCRLLRRSHHQRLVAIARTLRLMVAPHSRLAPILVPLGLDYVQRAAVSTGSPPGFVVFRVGVLALRVASHTGGWGVGG